MPVSNHSGFGGTMRYTKTILAITPLLLSLVACNDTMGPLEDHWITVQGTIRSAEDGSPIEGAEVLFFGQKSRCSRRPSADYPLGGDCTGWTKTTQTDRQGTYSLTVECSDWRGMDDDTVSIQVSKPGYYRANRSFKCSSGAVSVDLNLEPA